MNKSSKKRGEVLVSMALVSGDMKKAVTFAEDYGITEKELCKIAIKLGEAGYKLP